MAFSDYRVIDPFLYDLLIEWSGTNWPLDSDVELDEIKEWTKSTLALHLPSALIKSHYPSALEMPSQHSALLVTDTYLTIIISLILFSHDIFPYVASLV